MAQINETIEIDAPVNTVFDSWSDLTKLPEILRIVKEVKLSGEDQSLWRRYRW